MRVGDCESYAKIINWKSGTVHRNERKRTHSRRMSRRQSSRDIRVYHGVYVSLKSKLILSPQNFALER